MKRFKKIAVIIPCRNEEKGIGKVIDGIPVAQLRRLRYLTQIIIVDNGSKDNTKRVAQSKSVRVVREDKPGKGNAIKRGFMEVSSDVDFIVMLDGDNTYKGKEIPRLIEPLESNFCDVVIGSRLGGKLKKHSLKFSNRLVNWGFTFLVRQFYRANVTDVLSGYFAWKRKVVVDLIPNLEVRGFAIEMEMITRMVKMKYEMYSVPITYDLREGESKIASISDGIKILATFFLNLTWKPGSGSPYRGVVRIKESLR